MRFHFGQDATLEVKKLTFILLNKFCTIHLTNDTDWNLESGQFHVFPTCTSMSLSTREMLTVWGCPLAKFLWSISILKGSLRPPKLYRSCRVPEWNRMRQKDHNYPELNRTAVFLDVECLSEWELCVSSASWHHSPPLHTPVQRP